MRHSADSTESQISNLKSSTRTRARQSSAFTRSGWRFMHTRCTRAIGLALFAHPGVIYTTLPKKTDRNFPGIPPVWPNYPDLSLARFLLPTNVRLTMHSFATTRSLRGRTDRKADIAEVRHPRLLRLFVNRLVELKQANSEVQQRAATAPGMVSPLF